MYIMCFSLLVEFKNNIEDRTLLNELWKEKHIKCEAMRSKLSIFITSLINSVIQEHNC